ncbi:26s proteasome non-atpase regulatory subunit 7 [Nannochloropsis oceanica]
MDVEKEKDKTKAGTDKGKKDGDKKKSEEETATSILTTGQLAADEIEVIVHPLVLLSTVDHYNRVAKDTRKRVVGVLLGTTWRGRIDVVNSFAVPFEEDLKNPLIWYLDHNYLESMFHMSKKINGGGVGVEHLLRDINDPSVSTLANQVKHKLVALSGLRERLEEMQTYLQLVLAQKIPVNNQIIYNMQTIFNLLPNLNVGELVKGLMVKANDMHFIIYLSSLIRAIVALHGVVQNKIDFSEGEEGGKEGGKKKEKEGEKEGKEEEGKEKGKEGGKEGGKGAKQEAHGGKEKGKGKGGKQ